LVASESERTAADDRHALVDDAMTAIARDNPSLEGTLPRDFACSGRDTSSDSAS
jgi:hypothetical protein